MFKHTDKVSEQSPASLQANPLREQAAALLCSPDSRAAFIQSMNANTDQVKAILDQQESTETFDALKERDEDAALQYAERHSSIQTHALHGTDDKEFQQNLRVRLTGQAEA